MRAVADSPATFGSRYLVSRLPTLRSNLPLSLTSSRSEIGLFAPLMSDHWKYDPDAVRIGCVGANDVAAPSTPVGVKRSFVRLPLMFARTSSFWLSTRSPWLRASEVRCAV